MVHVTDCISALFIIVFLDFICFNVSLLPYWTQLLLLQQHNHKCVIYIKCVTAQQRLPSPEEVQDSLTQKYLKNRYIIIGKQPHYVKLKPQTETRISVSQCLAAHLKCVSEAFKGLFISLMLVNSNIKQPLTAGQDLNHCELNNCTQTQHGTNLTYFTCSPNNITQQIYPFVIQVWSTVHTRLSIQINIWPQTVKEKKTKVCLSSVFHSLISEVEDR